MWIQCGCDYRGMLKGKDTRVHVAIATAGEAAIAGLSHRDRQGLGASTALS